MLALTALALLGLRLVAAQSNGTSSASAADIADVEANFQGELGAVGVGVKREKDGGVKYEGEVGWWSDV
jgi:hypothetical protein